MRSIRLWARVTGVGNKGVVVGVRHDCDAGEEVIVVSMRLHSRRRPRCGRCNKRAGLYDSGDGRRRWRSLDAGTTKVFIEADARG